MLSKVAINPIYLICIYISISKHFFWQQHTLLTMSCSQEILYDYYTTYIAEINRIRYLHYKHQVII